MKFGIEDHHWLIIDKILIAPLKAQGAQIWVFGSRATGKYKKFSDLDVIYSMGTRSLSPVLLAKITEDLEESTIPFKVDLVNENDLADSYREGVVRDRVKV